jgi:DNA polymerase I
MAGIEEMNLISFDIETWGLNPGYALQPWRAKTDEGGIICGFKYDGNELQSLLPVAIKSGPILCGWNVKFDIAWLLSLGYDEFLNYKYLDGMLLLKRIQPDLDRYGLKSTLERLHKQLIFPEGFEYIPEYSKEVEFKPGKFDERQREVMETYCKRDVVYTYVLTQYLISIASKEDIKQCICESTISALYADIWQRGIPLNAEEIETQKISVSNMIVSIERTLDKTGLTKTVIASPKQLREFLQNKWDVKLTKQTPKGELSVDASVLKNLVYSYDGITRDLLQLLVKKKSLQTEYDKFICSAEECVNQGELIHPDPILCSTDTGRLTYKASQEIKEAKVLKNGKTRTTTKKTSIGMPLHQIKRGETRKMFVAPKGYKLVELDFSGQEMRIIADIANETTMLDFFNSGKDLHAYTAANIYGYFYDNFEKLKITSPKEYKSMRQLGKLSNFGLQYRAGAKRLYIEWHDKHELREKTLTEAEHARNVYCRIYSGIPTYWRDIVNFAKANGYVTNKAGRKAFIDKWDYEHDWKSQERAINYPVQSTGAEQTTLALFCLRKFLYANRILLAWTLHDGMFFFVPDCMMTVDLVQEMVKIASNLPYKQAWGWEPKVQFPVEAKIGDNWGELQELK